MKKIWIDIDNSPHVLFFNPIAKALTGQGYELILTARDAYQVRELMQVYKMNAQVIGKHYGKNKLLKIMGSIYRAMQLAPLIIREHPDVAISHGSRGMVILSKLLNIPLILMFDYEHGKPVPFINPNLIIVPEIVTHIPFPKTQVLKYKGIKEHVYVPFFKADFNLKSNLNIKCDDIVIALRPPATEAHYHNNESDLLFHEVISFFAEHENIKMIILPRNKKQAEQIKLKWKDVYKTGKIIIPEHAFDGLNIIWNSDMLISGGGTMNREATALGVPVYSIFRGKMGAVDAFLQKIGKLKFIENSRDIHTVIELKKRHVSIEPDQSNRQVLDQIINFISVFLERPIEIKNYAIDDVQFKRPLLSKVKV